MSLIKSRRTIAAAIALAAAIVLVLGASALTVLRASRTAETRARDIAERARVAVQTPGGESLALLLADTGHILPDTFPVRSSITVLRLAGAAVGWMPYVGDNLAAVPQTWDRAALELQALRDALAAYEPFRLAYLQLGGGTDPLAALDSDGFLSLLAEGRNKTQVAAASLTAASSQSGLVRPEGLWGPIRRANDTLNARHDELWKLVQFADHGAEAIQSASAMARHGAEAQAIFGDSLTAVRDPGRTSQVLDNLSREAGATVLSAESALQAAPDFLAGSGVVHTVEDLRDAARALAVLAGAGRAAIVALTPALESLPDSDDQLFAGPALLSAAKALHEAGPEIAGAVEAINRRIEATSGLASRWAPLVLKLDELGARFSRVVQAAADLTGLARLAPSLLGEDSSKTYLVLGLTTDEIRPPGGFVSNIWKIVVEDGAIREIAHYDPGTVDIGSDFAARPPLPPELRLHMDAAAFYLRDVTWDPDFTTVATTARDIFRIDSGVEVDGVIAISQQGLVRVVGLMGGVSTGQSFVGPQDIIPLIEVQTDSLGNAFLASLVKSLLNDLTGQTIARDPVGFGLGVRSLFDDNMLIVHLFDSNTQAVIEALGWDGGFSALDRDRIGVFDANVGWSKSNRNVEREATYTVDLSDPAAPSASLSLKYTHASERAANCQTQAPALFRTYADSKTDCFWDYVRIYTALGATLDHAGPMPLPGGSIASRIWGLVPGSETLHEGIDSAGTYFSGLFALEAGESRQFSYSFRLPASTVRSDGAQIEYEVDYAAQSGANAPRMTVKVILPTGYALKSSTAPAQSATGDTATFELPGNRDFHLNIVASRG